MSALGGITSLGVITRFMAEDFGTEDDGLRGCFWYYAILGIYTK